MILKMLPVYMKRTLKHLGIVLMLIALPLTACIYNFVTDKNEGAEVGIYGSTDEIMEYLAESDIYVKFTQYTDIEKMKNDVETQKLECAFIFPENIEDMLSGKSEIILGEGYTSVMAEVTKETVFSAVLKAEGSKTALDFARKNNMGLDEEKFKQSYANYLKTIKRAVVFREINTAENEVTLQDFTVQCIIAAITLCAGLIGAAFVMTDRKRGIKFGAGSNIAAAMLVFVPAELAAALIIGYMPDILRFCLVNIAVWGLCSLLPLVARDERIPLILMPVCIVTVLVFDYIEVSIMVPSLKIIDRLLVSHYYVYSKTSVFAAVSVIFAILGFVSDRILIYKET